MYKLLTSAAALSLHCHMESTPKPTTARTPSHEIQVCFLPPWHCSNHSLQRSHGLGAAQCTCQTNKGLPMSSWIVKECVTCTLQHWQKKAVLCQYCWYLNSFLFFKGQTILAYNCNGQACNFNRISFLKGSLLLLKVKIVIVNYGKNQCLKNTKCA